MMALDYAVRSGKVLYAGISNYNPEQTKEATVYPKTLRHALFDSSSIILHVCGAARRGFIDVLEEKGVGCIAFSPFGTRTLTNKYLKGIPENSRAFNPNGHLLLEDVSEVKIQKIIALNDIAKKEIKL